MPDRPEVRALLDAARETPGEWPRRVLADWFDDHGEPARAVFIRLQLERATLEEDDARCAAMLAREGELLAAHEADWLGDLLATPVRTWEFRRGMLHVHFEKASVGSKEVA